MKYIQRNKEKERGKRFTEKKKRGTRINREIASEREREEIYTEK